MKSASSYICHEVHDSHRFLPALGARRQGAAAADAVKRRYAYTTSQTPIPNYYQIVIFLFTGLNDQFLNYQFWILLFVYKKPFLLIWEKM